jgi:DNA (cytosine-5)-methyltransferase 1
LAKAFPVKQPDELFPLNQFFIQDDRLEITNKFNELNKRVFENTGIMIEGEVSTIKSIPNYNGNYTLLKDIIIENPDEIDEVYFLDDLIKWKALKGPKNIFKTNKDNITYKYSEGQMVFPDPLERPSRTIITGEGGKSPSRFKHVIEHDNRLRRLTPVELERLNMFPDNHTKLEGISDAKRAFFMGNALVVGVVEKIGIELAKNIKNKIVK